MIRFRMAKINIGQFAILTDEAPTERLSYNVELGFKCATADKRIGCDLTIAFMHNDITIIKLNIFCEFDIMSADWNNLIKNNALIISKDELGYFANQTVGVARGIMFCKTEGTPFSKFIVPPINLTMLITDDFKITLDDIVA